MPHKIKPLPKGDLEIRSVAGKRAKDAFKKQNGDYAIGFCEGVIEVNLQYFTCVWCVILTQSGEYFSSGGVHILLSEPLNIKMKTGELLETDVESYIQDFSPDVYQQLVEWALRPLVIKK